jgi:8-oxo-dGTP diphosphatase
MVDGSPLSANYSDTADWILVVAGALVDQHRRWVMHQRPAGKMYADLWEFPGGKVEHSEMPAQSLCRELREELGIAVAEDACRPSLFAQDGAIRERPAIVLLLYTINIWRGQPRALEGGEVGWFAPQDALELAMPPLDRQLAEQLFLPARGEPW